MQYYLFYSRKSFFKNALSTLTSEILEFDDEVRDHIKERGQGSQNFNFEPQKIKIIFEQLYVLGFADDYFENFYIFLNKES